MQEQVITKKVPQKQKHARKKVVHCTYENLSEITSTYMAIFFFIYIHCNL